MNILVRLPNWLGDVVMSLPFIEALGSVYPKARVEVVVKKPFGALLHDHPYVEAIHDFSKDEFPGLLGGRRFGRKLKRQTKFDLFFCLPNSFSSAWMGAFSGAKERIGYKSEGRNFLFTKKLPIPRDLHRTEKYLYLLEAFSGKKLGSISPNIPTLSSQGLRLPQGKNVLLNINSEAQSRRMPIAMAKELISMIHDRLAHNILLTGAPKEALYITQLGEEVLSKDYVHNFSGKTNLLGLFELVQKVDAVLTVDSGIAHIANAFQKPTVVLFGAGNEAETRPYYPQRLAIIRKPGLDCAPCLSNSCKFGEPRCLYGLESERIVEVLAHVG